MTNIKYQTPFVTCYLPFVPPLPRGLRPTRQRSWPWRKYRERGVAFLGIVYVDTEPEARAYVEKYGLTYPNGPDLGSKISRTYRITVRPLWQRDVGPEAMADNAGETIADLLARRDATYETLKEIEFDFQAGKLLEEDYHALLARYRAEAVAILQQLDKATAEADTQIEREVAALRRSAALICPACGRHYQEGDRFCAGCDAPLPR
jgi:hypothetical protein